MNHDFTLELSVSQSYEIGLIGSILLDETCFANIVDKVNADDFTGAVYSEIYATMCDMYACGQPIDYISVTKEMAKKGFSETDIHALTLETWNLTPTAGNAQEYANGIRNESKMRKIKNLVTTATESHSEPNKLIDALLNGLYSLERGSVRGTAKSMHELWLEFTSWSQKSKDERQVNTGFAEVDKMLSGMNEGNLILIAARPAVGKSAFGAEIALKAAEKGTVSVVFSAEMSSLEIYQRYISSRARVDLDEIVKRKFKLDLQSETKVANAANSLGELPLYIYDEPGINIMDIRRTLQTVKNVGFVVVDYLQLMKSTEKSENRNLELADISRGLKIIAKEFKIPVVALSQLSRKKDETDEPGLTDLRDSGSLEQDADKVIMLWKLDESTSDGEFPRVGVKVAKSIMGKVGTVVMRFNGGNMTFFETTEEYVSKKRGRGRQFEVYNTRADPDFPFDS